MTEQAKPFKAIQNRIETLGAAPEAPATPEKVAIKPAVRVRPGAPLPPAEQRTVLDSLLASGWINWEVIAWVVLLALAVVTRMWDLAPKGMHHDESIHAQFSYEMFKGRNIYRYDPTWHGPVLYYMVTLSYFILGGASEFSARFAPALFGVGLVAISWFLRPIIGRVGALSFAILMLVSPSVLYYSRSLRHDIFATFGMLLFLIGFFRYAQEKPGRRTWWMALAGVGFFLLFGSHEMSFFNLGLVLSWLGIIFLFEIIALPARIRRLAGRPESPEAGEPEEAVTQNQSARPPSRPRYADDDEMDDPYQAEAEQAVGGAQAAEAAALPETRPAPPEQPEPAFDATPARATAERDPWLGRFNLVYAVLFGLFALLVLVGAIHLFVDKGRDSDIQQLFGLPAWSLLIPFYLLLAAAVSYPLARLINLGYNRLSRASNLTARIGAAVVFAGLALAATFLFLRGKSPAAFVTALGIQLSGNSTPAINKLVSDGYASFSEFAYVGLKWPSLLPQLVAVLVVALLAGALAGWLVERRLLTYTPRGFYTLGLTAFAVTVISILVSLRFVLVPDRSNLPKVILPGLGLMDKWLAYVVGGVALALVIGLVAGWFVSMGEQISDEELRGSTVLRAVLKFTRTPAGILALLAGFGILYVLIFSNFFFAPERLADGFYRGLEYWGEQHGKRRLDQPWFYYPMLMLLYETAAVFLFMIALVYFPVTFWRRTGQRGRFIFTPRGVFIGLAFWWSFLSLVFYSIAGEKIPWLNMQIAVPVSLVAAAFLNDYLRRFNWKRLFSWNEGLLFGGVFLLTVIASLVLIGMAINFPRRDQFNLGLNRVAGASDLMLAIIQMTLVGAIGLGLFGFSLWLWWSNRLDGRIARAVIMLVIGGTLFAYGVKSTIALNFDHPDVSVEPMIYTQTTPEVPLFVQRLGRLSRDLRDVYKVVPAAPSEGQPPAIYPDPANSKGLPLYVSGEVAWPLSWYLREYTNVTWGTINSDVNSPTAIDKLTDNRGNNYVMVMVSAGENTSKLQQQLQGQYTSQQYRFRWHFPEDSSGYGGLGYVPPDDYREGRIAEKDIINTRWDMFVRSFTEQPFAGRLWRYLMYRELWQPLQSFDMVVFMRNDVYADFALTPGTSNTPVTANTDSLPAFDLTASTQAGNRNGQYRTPRNVAVAPNGDVLVLDSLNGRVQRFDKDGKFLSKFGTIGTGDGQFTLAQYESGPGGITVDEDGNIYVTDTWGYRIQKFDRDGKLLLKWGNGKDTQGNPELGKQFPTSFYGPRSIYYDREAGELYVTDTGNRRVVVYDRQGQFKRQFGSRGNGPGQFDEPVSVALSPDGKVYVADMRNRRVQVLDKQGSYLREIAVPSWKEAVLSEPYLAFEPQSGDLFVSDPANAAILRFNKDGQPVSTYGTATGLPLVNPVGLAFDPEGNLYIADARRNSIVKFKP